MNKINLLIHENSYDIARFSVWEYLKGIPLYLSTVLHISQIHNADFWIGINNNILGLLDFSYIYLNDKQFIEYVNRISIGRQFAILYPSVFYNNFGTDSLNKKNKERHKRIYQSLKSSSDTIILSPEIGIDTNEDLIHECSQYYDAYALKMKYDMEDQTLGTITRKLNKIITANPKPVYVTTWEVPCCDHTTFDIYTRASLGWFYIDEQVAANRMLSAVQSINEIARNDIHWFFTGIDKDYHRQDAKPTDFNFWNLPYHKKDLVCLETWNYNHFSGIVDSSNNIKTPIVDMLVKLSNA